MKVNSQTGFISEMTIAEAEVLEYEVDSGKLGDIFQEWQKGFDAPLSTALVQFSVQGLRSLVSFYKERYHQLAFDAHRREEVRAQIEDWSNS